MIRFLIRPTDPRLLILSQISSETNRFTGHFDLLPRISRTVTSRTSDPLLIPSNRLFHSDSLELPSFSSLSLSLIGDDRLVVRVIVKIMIRVGRPGNRCRAWIGCTLSLLPSSHLFDTSVYIYIHVTTFNPSISRSILIIGRRSSPMTTSPRTNDAASII